jgi:AcrR family transcriptional regulator
MNANRSAIRGKQRRRGGTRPAPSAVRRSTSVAYSAAQTRIIAAALDLFAEHGVGGTSLQMIADAIGVTKAAVYHQFPTKDEIILAVAGLDVPRLEAALDDAEAAASRAQALDVLMTQLIALAVERRRTAATYQGDPVMVRFVSEHAPFRRAMERLNRLLIRGDDRAEARVRAAMVSAAIGAAVTHPLVADLDDETLRTQLERLAKRLVRQLG